MSKFFGCIFFCVGVALLGDLGVCAGSPVADADVSEELTPIPGWDRYSGDSARSFGGWFRWWTYLSMKEPETIDWMCGLKLKIFPGNEIFRALFVRGVYDPNLIVVVNALLRKGGVFIDVGANMGYFSLLASRVVGKEGKIFALEPSSRDFGRLQDNIKINNLQKVILPLRLAISGKVGPVKLSVACEERSALNTVANEFSFKGVEKIDVEEVDSTTIDRFVQKKRVSRVDVLKLDIEGSEVGALRGALSTIERYRPAIMLGINAEALKSCGSSVGELQKILKNLRYKIYKIVEDPTFALKEVEDVEKARSKVVFCLHESMVPPSLLQPKERSIMDQISCFFSR
ncbi:MAG: FkbM family methyltransferase [Holosporaceae bacterium]|jgi:FkbM family methyltransferase|nr:FkbM family methyltransferase [Holosporaceae bacterium]